MAKIMNQDLEAIRHFTGNVADFKNFFDQKAAETAKKDKENTNAYGTPEYQGFNDVHPTRGANASSHWDESVNLEEKKNENPFKKGDKIIVTKLQRQGDAKRFKGKKGFVLRDSSDNYVMVKLKGFSSPEIEFHKGEIELDESVNEDTVYGKKFQKVMNKIPQWDWLSDDPGESESWEEHLGIDRSKLKDYIILYSYANDNWNEVKKLLDRTRIKYEEMDDPDTGEATIVFKVNESLNEDKEVTQEMWDKEWKIRKTFGKEYEEHFAKRIEAAMSKAKNEEMAENWAFINWKQLPGKAKGMTIKESSSTSTKGDRLPLFEDFQG